MTRKTDTTTPKDKGFNLLSHLSSQLKTSEKASKSVEAMAAKMAEIDDKKRKIREREKALMREQRFQRPAVETEPHWVCRRAGCLSPTRPF
jgi:hypothetical protein